MNQCLLIFALLTLIACNGSTSDVVPTEHNDTIETYDSLAKPIAFDIDQTHGELVLMPDSFYLNHPNIPDSAKLLYSRSIIPMDDYYTFTVFDSMETANDTMLPFYFYTTIIISEQSDGALSEMVGLVIHAYALHHPKRLSQLLALPDVIKGKTNRDIWLEWTLTENGIDNEGYELEGIEQFSEQMHGNSKDSATVAFTKQYVQDLKNLLPKRK